MQRNSWPPARNRENIFYFDTRKVIISMFALIGKHKIYPKVFCSRKGQSSLSAANKTLGFLFGENKMKILRFCQCGCGEIVSPGRRFMHGHNLLVIARTKGPTHHNYKNGRETKEKEWSEKVLLRDDYTCKNVEQITKE